MGEVAVAVHDLPDRSVAAGDAAGLGRTAGCFAGFSSAPRRANMLPIIRRYIMFIFKPTFKVSSC